MSLGNLAGRRLRGVLAIGLIGAWAWPALGQSGAVNISAEKLLESAVADYDAAKYGDVAEAVKLVKQNDFSGAREALVAAKKKHPELAPAGVMMAQVLFTLSQVPAARAELEKVVVETPADPEPYLIFAELALAEGQITDADLLLTRGLALAEKLLVNERRQKHLQSVGHAGLAKVAEVRGNFADAEKHLVAWTELDPAKADAQASLGRVLFRLGKYKESAKALSAAAKADKNQPAPQVAMALLYEAAGEHDKAAKLMDDVLKLDGKNPRVLATVAQWELQTSQLDKAKTHADAAIKADPKLLAAKLVRALVARFQNDPATARKQLDDAVRQAPFDFQATNLLAQVLIDSDEESDQQLALKHAQSNMSAYRNSAEAAATLGWVCERLGRTADADRFLQAALSSGQLTSESAFFVATMLHRNGRVDDARKLLEQSLGKPFLYSAEAQELLAKLPEPDSGSKPEK